MKKHIAKISAILLILSLTAGIISGCNGNGALPVDNPDDYYKENDNDRKNTEDDREIFKTEDDGIRVSKDDDDSVIPDTGDDDTTEATNEPDATEPDATEPDDTEPADTEGPDETSGTSAAAPTEKTYGKTKVTSAYKKTFKTKYLGKVTSSYPKVTIEGVDTSAVNNQIKKDLASNAKKHKVKYIYHIGKNYVSILVTVDFDTDWEENDHFVYNISRETGKKLSRTAFLNALGIKVSSFESRAKKAIQKYWKKYKYNTMDKKAYAKAYSKSTLSKASAYVNNKGKLCYLVKSMELPVGGNYYDVTGTC